MKSGNLNFLELSGPLQACNGTDLPSFYECKWSDNKVHELATKCLPWQHWTKAVVWFDDDISRILVLQIFLTINNNSFAKQP